MLEITHTSGQKSKQNFENSLQHLARLLCQFIETNRNEHIGLLIFLIFCFASDQYYSNSFFRELVKCTLHSS